MFIAEFCIVILAMILGARYGGIFFGMAGGVGLMALILIFGLAPASPPYRGHADHDECCACGQHSSISRGYGVLGPDR